MKNICAAGFTEEEAGFSLLEVLIAMVILSLSGSVFLGTQIASVRAARLEGARANAIAVAESLDALAISTGGKVCADGLSVQTGLASQNVADLCAASVCDGSGCTANVWNSRGELLVEHPP